MLRRFAVQLRAVQLKGNTLHGHASVFGVHADLGDGTVERMGPTAFDAVLEDEATDPRALWNHDPSQLLGRQSAGTLHLRVDGDRGLAYAVDLPDTSYARDLRVLVERGDLDGASFGFIPGEVVRDRTEDGRPRVTHTSVAELLDVSPVTYPAYQGASTALRMRPMTFDRPTLTRVRSQTALVRHRIREARP